MGLKAIADWLACRSAVIFSSQFSDVEEEVRSVPNDTLPFPYNEKEYIGICGSVALAVCFP